MDLKRFESLLDRYGSRPRSWPADAVQRARSLLSCSSEARRSRDVMRRVEAALDAKPKVDPASVTRVVNGALSAIREMPERLSWAERLRAAFVIPVPRLAFVVSATAIGFAIGFIIGVPGADRTAEDHTLPLITASAGDALF